MTESHKSELAMEHFEQSDQEQQQQQCSEVAARQIEYEKNLSFFRSVWIYWRSTLWVLYGQLVVFGYGIDGIIAGSLLAIPRFRYVQPKAYGYSINGVSHVTTGWVLRNSNIQRGLRQTLRRRRGGDIHHSSNLAEPLRWRLSAGSRRRRRVDGLARRPDRASLHQHPMVRRLRHWCRDAVRLHPERFAGAAHRGKGGQRPTHRCLACNRAPVRVRGGASEAARMAHRHDEHHSVLGRTRLHGNHVPAGAT